MRETSPLCPDHGSLRGANTLQGHAGVFERLSYLLQTAPKVVTRTSQLHPLDPLTPDEIIIASGVCRKHVDKTGGGPVRFNAITLQVLLPAPCFKAALHLVPNFQKDSIAFSKKRVIVQTKLNVDQNCLMCSDAETWIFAVQEPPKAEQLRYNNNPATPILPRVALCIIQMADGSTVVEALVAVSEIPPVVLSWDAVSLYSCSPKHKIGTAEWTLWLRALRPLTIDTGLFAVLCLACFVSTNNPRLLLLAF